ncbi:hypothetical protein [Pedobacter sp. UBA5917]|jgi:hypothetical protein|uniref:hypothetical protein n=1 Tax=Pedobacter sp. UBA5917 TaxID=1947061 RepID=UPI0025F591E6|nr:hypothetical protein [Pedobacter sp. UBA5917]
MKKIVLLLIYVIFSSSFSPAWIDTDGDGIANEQDLDDDNDGIADIIECPPLNTAEFNGTFGAITLAQRTRDLQTPITQSYAYGGRGTNSLFPAARYVVTSHLWSDNIHSSNSVWQNFYGHTTGDDTDAFLAVNGSLSPAVLYQQSLTLQPNTAYRLSFFAINALTQIGYSDPVSMEMRFYNETTNTLITTIQSGDLYPTQKAEGSKITRDDWHETTATVNTTTGTKYRIEVVNISTSFSGNDFALDDITLHTLNCPDTDGDGIPDLEDTDSDNDGCSDSNEYYNRTNASGNDDRYGPQASRTVDATGKVIGASYTSTFYTNVITVNRQANINSAPTDKLIDAGSNTSYTANANTTAGTLIYQWQVSTDNKINWTNVTNGTRYSGTTTNTLNVNAVPKTMNGYFYRLLIRNSSNVCADVYTTPAILDIKPVAQNDLDCYTPGISRMITVLSNDNTGDNPVATTVVIVSAAVTDGGKKLIINNEGTWQVGTDGKITFTPEPNFRTQPTTISYKFQDAEGNDSNQATLTLKPTQSPQVQLTGSSPKQF